MLSPEDVSRTLVESCTPERFKEVLGSSQKQQVYWRKAAVHLLGYDDTPEIKEHRIQNRDVLLLYRCLNSNRLEDRFVPDIITTKDYFLSDKIGPATLETLRNYLEIIGLVNIPHVRRKMHHLHERGYAHLQLDNSMGSEEDCLHIGATTEPEKINRIQESAQITFSSDNINRLIFAIGLIRDPISHEPFLAYRLKESRGSSSESNAKSTEVHIYQASDIMIYSPLICKSTHETVLRLCESTMKNKSRSNEKSA